MALPKLELKATSKELHPLHDRLRNLGYEERNIAQLLGCLDISELNGKDYPGYLSRCEKAGTDLAALVVIFLLGRASTREALTQLLGSDLVAPLERCEILVEWRGAMVSLAALYPCLGKLFFTDHWVGTETQKKGKVYELGTDSYVLARVTPRRNVKRALDLCTGSGLHAVFSAAVTKTSKAVDINPRALQYTRLNALLNGVTCETLLGDLYSTVEGEMFDLITANPPFVPSPDPKVLIHRSPGESGEEVSQKLVEGLPRHLADGGLFSMILDHPDYEDHTYVDRLERWLGLSNGWGIAVLTFEQVALPNYIRRHLRKGETYHETFRAYLESYERLGIQSMCSSNVFILKLGQDQPNWKVTQRCHWPTRSLVPQIEEWLDCQQKYRKPNLRLEPDWKPTLNSNYKTLWRDQANSRGALERSDENWMQPEPLSAEEAELLFRMKDGVFSVSELRRQWGDEDSFLSAFRGLGIRRALQ